MSRKNKEDDAKYAKEYYKKHRDEILSRCKKYQYVHREERREYTKKWYQKNKDNPGRKDRMRDYWLKRQFGISLEEYNSMLCEQKGRCAICKTTDPNCSGNAKLKNFHIDHDHITGKVRGLLCNKCNLNLGWYEQWKTQAESYLKNN